VALAAVAVGTLIGYSLYDLGLFHLIRVPFDTLAGRTDNPFVAESGFWRRLLPVPDPYVAEPINLHFFSPIEVFMVKLKLSLLAGVVLSAPVVFWQIWAFVAVGLTEKERRAARVFLPVSLALFVVGILLAWFVILPVVLYFLVFVTGEGLIPTLMLGKYAALVTTVCLSFGLIFQLPVALFFLTRIGLVTPEFLARRRPYAILLIFLIAAVLTPPDIVTQFLMALPMMILFEIGIAVSRRAGRKPQG